MASMNHGENCYYERVSSIQQCMHERDKRRLELELELVAYSRSNRRLSQIRCSRLCSYLKEICESEVRAKTRNLELLRDVECIENDMKEYSSDHGLLQQQKAEFVNQVLHFETKRKTNEELNAQVKVSDVSHINCTEDLTQTFRGADADATNIYSHQALHHPSNRSLPFHESLPSGLLKDFEVSGERTPSNQAHLSDDISGSNDSPDGCNLSDKHEKRMAEGPSARALADAAGNVPFGSDDEQESSPLVTLTGPEKNQSSDSSSSSVKTKNDFPERTDSSLVAHKLPVPEDKESPAKEAWDAPDNSFTPEGNDDTPQSPISSLHSDGSNNTPHRNLGFSASVAALERLSLEGLFYLLDNIEGRLHCAGASVYGDSSVDGRRLSRVIRLCNSGADVKDEDLEICGAVVLRELQRLSWSTARGSTLSEDRLNAHQSSSDPQEISLSLPPDAAQLWDRWLKHALLLKESRVLSNERLVELFTPLLWRDAPYSHQAKVLLRTLASRSNEECPSAEDETDLSSLHSSPLLDEKDVTATRLLQTKPTRELQSSEEDSQDESSVESVPIRESKAYQLLKQSAMQTRQQICEEQDEDSDSLSGINHDHEEDLGRAKCSSHQDPYPWKSSITTKALSALQSKDMWSDSDEYSSYIEAAARPQPLNTSPSADDFDDFCD